MIILFGNGDFSLSDRIWIFVSQNVLKESEHRDFYRSKGNNGWVFQNDVNFLGCGADDQRSNPPKINFSFENEWSGVRLAYIKKIIAIYRWIEIKYNSTNFHS